MTVFIPITFVISIKTPASSENTALPRVLPTSPMLLPPLLKPLGFQPIEGMSNIPNTVV